MNTCSKSPTVAEYLAKKLSACGKTAQDIAGAIGHHNADAVRAFTQGTAKIPVNKIGPLARALEIDPVYFLRLVLSEYLPDVLVAIDDVLQFPMLTANERGLIDAYRKVSNGADAVAVTVTMIPSPA